MKMPNYHQVNRYPPNMNCGCYYCLKIFPYSDISDHVDGDFAAVCPHCGIDAVVYIQHREILPALMRQNAFYFADFPVTS